MTRSWKFDDLEFLVRWEMFGEQVPNPLTCTVRITDDEAYQQSKYDLREKIRDTEDRDIDEVMDILRHPEIRVEVCGWAVDDPQNVDCFISRLVVRRGPDVIAVEQLPGETFMHSGGFVVTEHAASALAGVAASMLPAAPAGRRGEVVLAERDRGEDMDYAYGRSSVRGSVEVTSTAEIAAEFLSQRAVHEGIIQIRQGTSLYGPRGLVTRRLEWRDLADDGRYLITAGTPQVAVPADKKRVTEMINKQIAEVAESLRDERP